MADHDEDTDQENAEPQDRAGLTEKPSQEVIDDIEAERERRLAPENRPDNTEIDNTDKRMVDGHLVSKEEADAAEERTSG